jgi:hypothetical protein
MTVENNKRILFTRPRNNMKHKQTPLLILILWLINIILLFFFVFPFHPYFFFFNSKAKALQKTSSSSSTQLLLSLFSNILTKRKSISLLVRQSLFFIFFRILNCFLYWIPFSFLGSTCLWCCGSTHSWRR